MTRVAIVGNCQAEGLARCLEAYAEGLTAFLPPLEGPRDWLAKTDLVFVQARFARKLRFADLVVEAGARLVVWPTFLYGALHPDMIYARDGAALLPSPLGHYHSALALAAWRRGLGVEETRALFTPDTFAALGYGDFEPAADAGLIALAGDSPLDMAALLARWKATAPFAHTLNHPAIAVAADIARALVGSVGLTPAEPEQAPRDALAEGPIWPLYPGLAERWGVAGDWRFQAAGGVEMDLDQFVRRAFDLYAGRDPAAIRADRFETDGARLEAILDRPARSRQRGHPYVGLPAHRFWRSGVTEVAPEALDPVAAPRFLIPAQAKVAALGSCFAQHIADRLRRRGDQFLDAEPAPEGLEAGPLFSVRAGNLYTARQLRQLLARATGEWAPEPRAWRRADGRFVDPYRPRIEPRGFASPEAVEAARARHLEAARRMFGAADALIFTLGLTEAWLAEADGAVLPLPPGAVAEEGEPARFVNFTAAEVEADLAAFLAALHRINPSARTILTVSPVPLAATYEERHVLVSTWASKAALRVAAEAIVLTHPNVDYFPAFELVSHNRERYFAADGRSVTPAGVEHVMRLFLAHYLAAPEQALTREIAEASEIDCDEDLLAR